ncbi:MAG: T9SS type A sorting domain-containing protein [Bacteroidetes bacterium]|nr:T9SS type A sorting domain-containing protein [Bacteroidota bacterium]
MKKRGILLLWSIVVPVFLIAQTIVDVPSDWNPNTGELREGKLNDAVQAALNAGTLSNTTFRLQLGGYYVLVGTLNVPAGQKLTIIAPQPGNTPETCPPQIVWTPTGGVNRSYLIQCNGHLTMKNLWVRYANTNGEQVGTTILFAEDPNAVAGQYGIFENVIFDYSPCPPNAGGAVTVTCTHFKGSFKNCYFKNCIDPHLRYYGRALSFPYQTTGWHGDSVVFENCTFANMGYVLMQEGGEFHDYVKFNHCTFLNVVMFPLESGWWYKLAVTNCLFVNCWMFGWMPAQTGKSNYTGKYEPNGGVFRIDSVSNFGFTPWWAQGVSDPEQERRILFTNSAYALEKWLVQWMLADNKWADSMFRARTPDMIPLPHPMLSPQTKVFFDSVTATGQKAFPYINRRNLYNGLNEDMLTYPWPWSPDGRRKITQVTGALDNLVRNEMYCPNFLVPVTDTALIRGFMQRKWVDNSDTNWAWRPYEGQYMQWPLTENLAYTNTTLQTAGMGGFPLGDLFRWWPQRYQQWLAQKAAEDATIDNWLYNGITSVERLDGTIIPAQFELYQNYPNPFNPSTTIRYTVPVKEHVTIKVYSLLGQEVATLVDEMQEPSEYKVTFTANNLASGVYFYRLKAGNIQITKKFVLMK